MTQAGSTHRHPRTGALTGALIGIHAREHSQASTHGNTLRHPCTGALTGTHGSTHRHPRTGALTDSDARELSQTPTHGQEHYRHPCTGALTDTPAGTSSPCPPPSHCLPGWPGARSQWPAGFSPRWPRGPAPPCVPAQHAARSPPAVPARPVPRSDARPHCAGLRPPPGPSGLAKT